MARPHKRIDISGGDIDFNVSSLQSQINKDPSMEREVKQEFTRLRDIAQKRIKRMGKSEFSESDTFQKYQNGWTQLKDIKKEDLATAFHELQTFVGSKKSAIKGQREAQKKTIETLQESGLNVTKKNYWAFWSVMHEMRSRKILYGSDKALELAEQLLARDNLTNTRSDFHTMKAIEDSAFSAMLEHSSELDMIPAGEDMSEFALQLWGK